MFDTTQITVRSTLVAERRDRLIAQRTKRDMRGSVSDHESYFQAHNPHMASSHCALLRRVFLDRDYQERKNAPPSEGNSLQ